MKNKDKKNYTYAYWKTLWDRLSSSNEKTACMTYDEKKSVIGQNSKEKNFDFWASAFTCGPLLLSASPRSVQPLLRSNQGTARMWGGAEPVVPAAHQHTADSVRTIHLAKRARTTGALLVSDTLHCCCSQTYSVSLLYAWFHDRSKFSGNV